MNNRESSSFFDSVQEITTGKPYVFVIMRYNTGWDFYEYHIKKVVEGSMGLKCIRADEVPKSGGNLLDKIHLLIQRAEMVISDISEQSPNVLYELGYAAASKKQILIVVKKGGEIPVNIQGLEVIEYIDDRGGLEIFDNQLYAHLKSYLRTNIPLLRDMLVAGNPSPAYIVASRRAFYSNQQAEKKVYAGRTFGDNLGILGLISAFGLFTFEGMGVELVSAQHCDPELKNWDVNLYLIASSKTNVLTKDMLVKLQKGKEPNWTFGAHPENKEKDDYWVSLYRTKNGQMNNLEGEFKKEDDQIIYKLDYGIIIRGPHPNHKDRIVLIAAGPHSLGTGAACLAITRSPLIQNIKSALSNIKVDIADKSRTFWVLVKGIADEKDNLLDMEGVTIEDVGVYE